MNAQADLNLRWAHMYVAAHISALSLKSVASIYSVITNKDIAQSTTDININTESVVFQKLQVYTHIDFYTFTNANSGFPPKIEKGYFLECVCVGGGGGGEGVEGRRCHFTHYHFTSPKIFCTHIKLQRSKPNKLSFVRQGEQTVRRMEF